MTQNSEYEVENAKKLVNGKITKVLITDDKESFGFIVVKGDKKFRVWVDGDQEGNHCGALDIEEL